MYPIVGSQNKLLTSNQQEKRKCHNIEDRKNQETEWIDHNPLEISIDNISIFCHYGSKYSEVESNKKKNSELSVSSH